MTTRLRSSISHPIRSERHNAPPGRLVGLQVLRGAAALQVVVQHTTEHLGHRVGLLGFGVPLFFVISGFIMVFITNERMRAVPFLRDRIIRVVPLYWLATTMAVALGFPSGGMRRLLASYLFVPWAGRDFHFFPVLAVGWTLNYELMFYGIFSVCLIAPRRTQGVWLTVIFMLLVCVGLLNVIILPAVKFWTEPVILQFLIGTWIGWWWKRGDRLFARPLLLCLATFLVAGLTFSIRDSLPNPRLVNDVAIGAVVAAVVLTALSAERFTRATAALRPLRVLGDASYSIYLLHPLVLAVFTGPAMRSGVPVWLSLIGTLTLSVSVGLASYVVIERPIHRWFARRR